MRTVDNYCLKLRPLVTAERERTENQRWKKVEMLSRLRIIVSRLRPRQVRYQAALRPDRCCSLHSKTLLDSPHSATRIKITQNRPYRGKTVTKPVSWASPCQNSGCSHSPAG